MSIWDILTNTLFVIYLKFSLNEVYYILSGLSRPKSISFHRIWKGKEWKLTKSEITINMDRVNRDTTEVCF